VPNLATAIDTDDCKMFAELRETELKSLNATIKHLAEKKPFVAGEFVLAESPVARLKVGYILAVCLPVWKSSAANPQVEQATKSTF